MERLCLLLISTLLLYSCKTQETKVHKLDFDSFTIETPKGWTRIIDEGFDSYVGRIQIDSTDFVSFDLGMYSNNLEVYLKNPGSSQWTLYPPLSKLGNNRNSRAQFDTIDGKPAKIIMPINSGIGMTGVYFDSLKPASTGSVQFEIFGNNLKPENEKLVLQAFKTIKFNLND